VESSDEGDTMSQDSDGVAEAVHGGAQLGLTLAAQAAETAVRMRERSRLDEAAESTRAAERARRRLNAEGAAALALTADGLDCVERAGASVHDSRTRREELHARLAASLGEEVAAARIIADTAQAHPARAAAGIRAAVSATSRRVTANSDVDLQR